MLGFYSAYDFKRWEAGVAACNAADMIAAVDPTAEVVKALREWGETEKEASHFKTLEEAKAFVHRQEPV